MGISNGKSHSVGLAEQSKAAPTGGANVELAFD
jgi:hypothetical protein